jgi:hemolysin activation/secretion protein
MEFCLKPVLLVLASSLGAGAPAWAAKAPAPAQGAKQPTDTKPSDGQSTNRVAPGSGTAPQQPAQRFDIDDFAVQGADKLPQIDIEEAIYPFLGPNKTAEDVEKARAALEKVYHDKGFQTVSVAVPQQNVQSKVVVLKVTELKVGRLRVKNSRYFDIDKIKDKAPSLKEGAVPNFNDVTKDIVALNQWPDRRVTPALRAGVAPGTVDVDLNVEDKPSIHGSLEVNNRQSPNTTETRVSATVHYDNLWQLGHSFSFTYQVAPERRADAEVYSASYLARTPIDWLNLMVYGVKSSSDVATVGGTNIVGPGEIVGGRFVMTLPSRDNFFHTLSIGVDYKHFDQTVGLGTDAFSSPVTYYPVVGTYGATFQNDKFTTQFNALLTYNLRPFSSAAFPDFDAKRFGASPSFAHFNVDVSHTQELPEGYQLWGKIQAQAADGPLVSSEQLSAGGLDTVRGYLESEVLGDDGVIGNFEIRSPDIGAMLQKQMKDETGQGTPRFTTFNEWRMFAFADGGHVSIQRPLLEQIDRFELWSYGIGSRFKVFNGINGVAVLAVPMTSQTYTRAGDPRFNFRLWGEF